VFIDAHLAVFPDQNGMRADIEAGSATYALVLVKVERGDVFQV